MARKKRTLTAAQKAAKAARAKRRRRLGKSARKANVKVSTTEQSLRGLGKRSGGVGTGRAAKKKAYRKRASGAAARRKRLG